MEALVQYASSDDEESRQQVSTSKALPLPVVNAAPEVEIQMESTIHLPSANQKQWTRNLPVESTMAPAYGPINAFNSRQNGQQQTQLQLLAATTSAKEIVTGFVESTNMEDFSFEAQYHQYNHEAKARDAQKPQRQIKQFTKEELEEIEQKQRQLREERNEKKRKASERSQEEGGFDEEMDFDRMIEKKTSHLLPPRLKAGQKAMEAKSTFLDDQEYDYQGRSWIEPPRTLRPVDPTGAQDHQVFLPKRCIHKWLGHTKGVQSIELFPKLGHLLLSGSLDHTVRIWDVYNERKCKRIYEGHSGAIRGINFSNDGKSFLTCSFDRFIHLWDTETGQSIQSFTNRRVPYCIKFYPEDNTNFVIGDSNNMIVQFDTRSGEIVQEYNHHLQAVNSVTFVDDNKRFVSTSDDKKILIWEWGIPVPIKYISEPSMHSMPAVTLHPFGGFFAGQCMNNQIDVYTARDKFKLCRKKIFKGHMNAGYACQIGFSPNGQFLMSGDGEGKLVFWDWKSTKLYKKLRAHDRGPCIGAIWHPIEPSRVVTCGWDGAIKYWD